MRLTVGIKRDSSDAGVRETIQQTVAGQDGHKRSSGAARHRTPARVRPVVASPRAAPHSSADNDADTIRAERTVTTAPVVLAESDAPITAFTSHGTLIRITLWHAIVAARPRSF